MAKKSGKSLKRKTTADSKAKASRSKAKIIKESDLRVSGPRKLKVIRKIPGAFSITKTSIIVIKSQPKLFLGLTLIYGLLNLLLVKGLSSTTDVVSLKSTLGQVFHGQFGSVFSGLGVFAVLVGSAGGGSAQGAGAYQMILTIVASLAIIWSLRQVISGHHVRIRDALYLGMYPLIPFTLVLLYVFIQLLPILAGSWIYTNVVLAHIATTAGEQAIFIIILILLAWWSFYLVSSSIFALYIVTLPDMSPMKAIRSAKALVKKRRLMVFRKLIFLPVALLIVGGIVMLPVILLLTTIAQWVFFILTMLVILAVNSYVYTIYRELIND